MAAVLKFVYEWGPFIAFAVLFVAFMRLLFKSIGLKRRPSIVEIIADRVA